MTANDGMSALTAERAEQLAEWIDTFVGLPIGREIARALRNLAAGIRYVAPGGFDGDIGEVTGAVYTLLTTGEQP